MIKYKATQNNVAIDRRSGNVLITFEISEGCTDQSLDACEGKELTLTVQQYRQKRSLDANNYYWQLLGKLAQKLNMSTTRLHNLMLIAYGTLDIIDDKLIEVWIADDAEAEKKIAESSTYHLKPTDFVAEGKRLYHMIKGSHEYNTAEMSRLINGLVSECEQQDIPTLTPNEIAKLKYLEGSNE